VRHNPVFKRDREKSFFVFAFAFVFFPIKEKERLMSCFPLRFGMSWAVLQIPCFSLPWPPGADSITYGNGALQRNFAGIWKARKEQGKLKALNMMNEIEAFKCKLTFNLTIINVQGR
jgi:hypothetical protein